MWAITIPFNGVVSPVVSNARHRYLFCPKEGSAEGWVEKITEVMFARDENEAAGTRDYNDFLAGYNDVKPADSVNRPVDLMSA